MSVRLAGRLTACPFCSLISADSDAGGAVGGDGGSCSVQVLHQVNCVFAQSCCCHLHDAFADSIIITKICLTKL